MILFHLSVKLSKTRLVFSLCVCVCVCVCVSIINTTEVKSEDQVKKRG
jgi:hypothetical protein